MNEEKAKPVGMDYSSTSLGSRLRKRIQMF
jgi:hypothetical protein